MEKLDRETIISIAMALPFISIFTIVFVFWLHGIDVISYGLAEGIGMICLGIIIFSVFYVLEKG